MGSLTPPAARTKSRHKHHHRRHHSGKDEHPRRPQQAQPQSRPLSPVQAQVAAPSSAAPAVPTTPVTSPSRTISPQTSQHVEPPLSPPPVHHSSQSREVLQSPRAAHPQRPHHHQQQQQQHPADSRFVSPLERPKRDTDRPPALTKVPSHTLGLRHLLKHRTSSLMTPQGKTAAASASASRHPKPSPLRPAPVLHARPTLPAAASATSRSHHSRSSSLDSTASKDSKASKESAASRGTASSKRTIGGSAKRKLSLFFTHKHAPTPRSRQSALRTSSASAVSGAGGAVSILSSSAASSNTASATPPPSAPPTPHSFMSLQVPTSDLTAFADGGSCNSVIQFTAVPTEEFDDRQSADAFSLSSSISPYGQRTRSFALLKTAAATLSAAPAPPLPQVAAEAPRDPSPSARSFSSPNHTPSHSVSNSVPEQNLGRATSYKSSRSAIPVATTPHSNTVSSAPSVSDSSPAVLSSPQSPTSSMTSRKRSQTLGSYNNPPKYEENASTGFFSSISNFMRVRRQNNNCHSQPQSPQSPQSPQLASPVSIASPKKGSLPPFEDNAPSTYLDHLLSDNPVTAVAAMLSHDDDEFLKLTLREYLRRYFCFAGIPLDMALRTFLILSELPEEVQQIDRVMYEFGKHYSEQNVAAGLSVDTCYILAYALIILHTDRFNPNNKNKMKRWEFIDNILRSFKENGILGADSLNDLPGLLIRGILGYLFDNIVHARFVRIHPSQCDQALQALNDSNSAAFLPYPSASALEPPYGSDSSLSLPRSSSSQLSLNVAIRKKSSFLWSQPPIDAYEYIVERKVKNLRLEIDFHYTCPFIGLQTELAESEDTESLVPSPTYIHKQLEGADSELDMKTYRQVIGALTNSTCRVVLKVPKHKAAFLEESDCLRTAYFDDDTAGEFEEFYIVRVVKLGIMARQECKLRAGMRSWRKYFCMLTSAGMFFFKNVNLFRMIYFPGDETKKTLILEESPAITPTVNLLDNFGPNFTISQGAFATRTEENCEMERVSSSRRPYPVNTMVNHPHRYTFYIYAKESRDVYMVDNLFELKSWIRSINYTSAISSVSVPYRNLVLFEASSSRPESSESSDSETSQNSSEEDDETEGEKKEGEVSEETSTVQKPVQVYTEVSSRGKESVDTVLAGLRDSRESSTQTLLRYLQAVQRVRMLTPLEQKTRDELMSSSKILNAKLEWLWFELHKASELCRVVESCVQQ